MKIYLSLFIVIVLFTTAVFPQKTIQKYHAFSGTFLIGVEGGASIGSTDYKDVHLDYLGRASLEYFLPAYTRSSFGIKAFASGGFFSYEDTKSSYSIYRTDFSQFGGGIIYALSLNKFVYPYLFTGAAYTQFNPKDDLGNTLKGDPNKDYKKKEINYLGEVGIRFLVTENLSFNLNGNVSISPNDNLDGIVTGANNDVFFSVMAGLSFAFFTEQDSDNDGVVDSKDLCPNTPPGILVDENGCPKDSDKDGVPDYLDRCSNTPFQVKVDENGCPIDSDKDGVPDYMDLCPDTPRGIKVDDFGCSYDLDGDGVPDYLDKCPNTPSNVSVDEHGCPKDSDNDGVPDHLDVCPDTPAGVKVDEFGCPVKEEEPKKKEEVKAELPKEVILSSGTTFAFNKTELLPSAFTELDKLVAVMKQNPTSRWRIEGHTDNIGSDANNKKVSLDRAQAVLRYFTSKGLNQRMFEVVGLGKDFPIADNSTEAGRAKNRRVAIIRIK